MEYYISSGLKNNDDGTRPHLTSEQLSSVLEDLAIYPLDELDKKPSDWFVVAALKDTGHIIRTNPALVEGGVIHAIGELVREGKTPAIRKGAIDNLESCLGSIYCLHMLDRHEASLVPAAATAMNEILDELQSSLKRINNADDTDIGQRILDGITKTIGAIASSGWDKDKKPIPEACKILAKTWDFLEESMVSHPDPALRRREISLYSDLAKNALLQEKINLKTVQDALLLSATDDPSPDVRSNAFSCLEWLYAHFGPYNDPRAFQQVEERKATSAEALDFALSSMADDTDPVVRRAAVNLVHAALPYVEKSSRHRIFESLADLAGKENNWDVLECAAATVHKLERSSSWNEIRPHASKLYKAFGRAAGQAGSEYTGLSSRSALFIGTLHARQKMEIERTLQLSPLYPPSPR